MIIDTHVHIYPQLKDKLGPTAKILKAPKLLKNMAAKRQEKLNKLLQTAQSKIRELPKEVVALADGVHGAASAPGFLLNSSKDDLLESMDKNGIDKAIVIAHPPLVSNDFVLKTCADEPRLYPVVNIPKGDANPGALLKQYIAQGALALKIHAAADGFETQDPHYLALLKTANELELPVIIHTGCIHIKPFYKNPEMGHAERFESWFGAFPKVSFVLAHMNYHYPDKAIAYCQKHQNVFCDISWQPSEVIAEALEKIPDKVMFGTDWPIVGSNQETMLERTAKANGSPLAIDALMRKNAQKVFKLI